MRFHLLRKRVLIVALSLPVGACEPADGSSETASDTEAPDELERVTIDARDETRWVHFDLEAGAEVTPATPEDSPEWDLAFSRFNVAVNGGTSGSGGVVVATLAGVTFDEVAQAPADGYVTDEVSSIPEPMELEPGYAFDLWYDYDPITHALSARGLIHVVRTVEGAYYKIELLDYYDTAGSAGFVSFRYEPIEPPA
ncbi:MAG: HmuY family protein [Myxococcales bacterium]|nr:HmuY family protein [Myxococcales bacterium]